MYNNRPFYGVDVGVGVGVDVGGNPLRLGVGGDVDVTAGTGGTQVCGVLRQELELPALTGIGGVALPFPHASPSTITTFVPAAIAN